MSNSQVNVVEYNGQLYRVVKKNETSSRLEIWLKPLELSFIKARDVEEDEIERVLKEAMGKDYYD